MSEGKLLLTKYRGTIYKSVDEDLAARLPALRLPRMREEARAAFRAILTYEKPPANGSLVDFLQLAEARGYCAHPCDWIPDYDWIYAGRHPELYQPWVDWLSEEGLTKFHAGNRLTPENYRRFSPGQRKGPIENLIREGRHNNFEGIKAVAEAQPASGRAELAASIDSWGLFDGCYPWQVPLLEYFLEDTSDKVRDIARTKLEKMGTLVTEAAHAALIASHMKKDGGSVSFSEEPAPHTYPFMVNFACTTFDHLATALGLSPQLLAELADLEQLGPHFGHLLALTGDVDARSIVAVRLLGTVPPEHVPVGLFRGVEASLRERGLRSFFRANSPWIIMGFPGFEAGSIDESDMRDLRQYEFMAQSVQAEIKSRKLPVNIQYDPLRNLALQVNKAAAAQVLDEALSLGMKPDNPRLTMLKLNLAL